MKRSKLSTILSILFIFVVGVVNADLPYAPKFVLEPPTTFTDGRPLTPALDLAGYPIRCTGPIDVAITMPSDVTTWSPPLGTFAAGSYTCTARALATTEKGGEESVDSSPVNFIVGEKAPLPLVIFGVE